MSPSSKGLLLALAAVGALSCGGSSGAAAASGGAPGTGAGGQDAGQGGGPGDAGGSPANGGAGAAGGAAPAASCANVDATLPPEPVIPAACATLEAALAITPGTPPSEATLDTARIQSALSGCAAGQAVKLTTSGANDAFVTGPLNIPSGVSLWIDAGTTLFGTRDPAVYGQAAALIGVHGAGSGIYGDGTIDGQGGEPQLGGTQSWWDVNGGGGSSPALIQVIGATNFTLYKVRLQNAPMFHVKLGAAGFVVWGITIKTPSAPTNSVGTKLTPSSAHNTDGVDPGQVASNGFIVYNQITVGDDHIAIKGGGNVKNLVIAHNHFEAGHGMSIGSETNGGVSNVAVCDLSIDGTNTGLSGGSSNGIRIKSDASRGGLVTNITYSDVCVRGLTNPIILTPKYSSATGVAIPTYTGITIQNFRSMSTSVIPKVTILGYDAAHMTGLTLDNVVVDDLPPTNVNAGYANVTLGPGSVNFMPAGASVNVTSAITGSSVANPCTGKWVAF
ncbi:MAG TPA: glycosyl hydrolase family 28 protein [Polyangia bacterium]|nr:glycosyl hydrolase family 28 protein [Polyangia bacterium]